MGTISFQVVETGQPTLTKVYSVADADIDKIVAAYQRRANISVGGTATRTQILQFWLSLIVTMTQNAVQQNLTTPPQIPPSIPFV